MTAHFTSILRSQGIAVTPEEVCDIFWLALQIEQLHPESVGSNYTNSRHFSDSISTDTSDIDSYLGDTDRYKKISSKSAFRSPIVAALPGKLHIEQALRPLKRWVPSQKQFELDELATVRQHSESGIWLPILHPAQSRWLDATLVIDNSPSMIVWQDTVLELQKLLTSLGIFRDVQIWHIGSREDRTIYINMGLDHTAHGHSARSPRELIDPTNRRLILVVSDCIATYWHNGAVARILRMWGDSCMAAIIQVLPERLWMRTGLSRGIDVFLQSPTSGVPNNRLRGEVPSYQLTNSLKTKSVPIPVVTLEPEILSLWAEFIAGSNRSWMPGIMLPLTTSSDEMSSSVTEKEYDLLPDTIVQIFDATASPTAQKLARYLSAAPLSFSLTQSKQRSGLLGLGTIRLIQRVMLPDSFQVHLAEVLLSGLVRRVPTTDHIRRSREIRFDFVDGVRELLLDGLRISEAKRVLELVSQYVGRSAQMIDFSALLTDPTTDKIDMDSSEQSRKVAIEVLQKMGGQYEQLAQHLKKDT